MGHDLKSEFFSKQGSKRGGSFNSGKGEVGLGGSFKSGKGEGQLSFKEDGQIKNSLEVPEQEQEEGLYNSA